MNASLDTICQQIALGRQLARRLTVVLRGQVFGEAELRLLWLLSQQAADGLEQRGLAEHLGVSPAQVSGIVEKLRQQHIIEPITNDSDRRRQRWQLTPTGCEQFAAVVAAVEPLISDCEPLQENQNRWRSPREDAA